MLRGHPKVECKKKEINQINERSLFLSEHGGMTPRSSSSTS